MWEESIIRLFGRVDTPQRAMSALRWMAFAVGLSGLYVMTAGATIRGAVWVLLAVAFSVFKAPVLGLAILGLAVLEVGISSRAVLAGAPDPVGIGMALFFLVFALRAVQVGYSWRRATETS